MYQRIVTNLKSIYRFSIPSGFQYYRQYRWSCDRDPGNEMCIAIGKSSKDFSAETKISLQPSNGGGVDASMVKWTQKVLWYYLLCLAFLVIMQTKVVTSLDLNLG